MTTRERMTWLLIGCAVGAGIALLYAPQSGKETRKLVGRKAAEARDAVLEKGEQVRDTLVDTGERIAEAGRGAYRKGAGIASDAATRAAGLVEAGRRAVKG